MRWRGRRRQQHRPDGQQSGSAAGRLPGRRQWTLSAQRHQLAEQQHGVPVLHSEVKLQLDNSAIGWGSCSHEMFSNTQGRILVISDKMQCLQLKCFQPT